MKPLDVAMALQVMIGRRQMSDADLGAGLYEARKSEARVYLSVPPDEAILPNNHGSIGA